MLTTLSTEKLVSSDEFATLKTEPIYEKRAQRALKFSLDNVDNVLDAYRKDDPRTGENILNKILQAVELAYESLVATGKPARQSPKHFKRAEIQTRRLLKQLDGLSRNHHFDERVELTRISQRISEINDQLLQKIMSNPRKK